MNPNKQVRSKALLVPGMYTDFLPPILRGKARDLFVYGQDILPLAVGATATSNIAIQDDSHFLLAAAVATFRTNATPPVVIVQPALTVTIEDTGSGRNLQNRAIDVENFFGSAALPAILPYPKLIRRASTIATTFQNLQGVAVQVRYSYIGFKIFPGISDEMSQGQWG